MITIVDESSGRFGRKKGVVRRVQRICENCQNKFLSKPYHKARFCSSKCMGIAKKGTVVAQNISQEEKDKRRLRMTGDKNPMWCGGDSDHERRNSAYKTWRIKVFKRDDFKCQRCGYRNGDGTKRKDLHAHHIVKWVDSIELRYEISNGMTLCVPCHIKEHTNIA